MAIPKVFFSYAREDGDFVLELARELRAAGVDLWLDQLDIAPGETWDRAVEEALDRCECLVVVLSQASVESMNVMDEVSFALEAQKQVVPVLKEACRIPFRLRRVQYVDFTRGRDAAFARLAEVLAGAAPTSPPPVREKRVPEPVRAGTSTRPSKRALAYGGGLAVVLGVALWLAIGQPRPAGLDEERSWDPANWDPRQTPAYVVVDSAYESRVEAKKRVAALNTTYDNSGFLWIPHFDSLSGAQLFQVYVGPFQNRADAERATCEYITRFDRRPRDHYAVLVSTRTTNQDRIFCRELAGPGPGD